MVVLANAEIPVPCHWKKMLILCPGLMVSYLRPEAINQGLDLQMMWAVKLGRYFIPTF